MDLASVDKLLTTTRTVRKRLDLTRHVEPEIIETCLELAIQAPTGSNTAWYHFVVITDPAMRAALASLYQQAMDDNLAAAGVIDRAAARRASPDFDSGQHLAEHFHEVPVLIQTAVVRTSTPAKTEGDGWELANILPAAWSLMLALRARGLGSAWTTILAKSRERELMALLGIPDHIRPAVTLPVAYYTGQDFKQAKRVPANERTYWNAWGAVRKF